MDRQPDEPKHKIPPERIRGYAQLAPEFAQYGLNVAAHFCHAVVERSIPHGSLAPELQTRMTRDQIKDALASAFEKFGSWPCDYDFQDVILVLCDDSVRVAEGNEDFGWPADVTPLRRRVILRFLWHFPAPETRSLPCTFWVSAAGQTVGVCKFAFGEPVQRPSSAKGVIATETGTVARGRRRSA